MSELSAEQKCQIRLEETFRNEVRKELETADPKSKVWRTLNAPFVLFVFSTIIVGLIGWGYSQLKADWDVRAQKALITDKLYTQYDVRLELAELMLSKAATADDYIQVAQILLYDTDLTRIYPEFKERSTLSIGVEAWGREKPGTGRSLSDFVELLQSLDALKKRLLTPLDTKQQQDTFNQIRVIVKKIDDL